MELVAPGLSAGRNHLPAPAAYPGLCGAMGQPPAQSMIAPARELPRTVAR